MKTLVCTVLLVSLCLPGFALEGKALLSAIDDQVTFSTDFAAECTLTQDRPGEPANVQKVVLYRRDRETKFTILILSPEIDKGKGYLKVGNNLWFYDPTARRFQVTSAKDRFQNSNARNSDFTKSNLANDYQLVSTKTEKLGRLDTTVLELVATNDNVTFPRSKVWVTADNLVRKTEDSSLSGQLLRTTAIPQYQKVGARFVPVRLIIIDNLRGRKIDGVMKNESTIIELAHPSVEPLTDLIFTQGYLEKVSS
jgi:outer membrane lipoprotein-sorting protein